MFQDFQFYQWCNIDDVIQLYYNLAPPPRVRPHVVTLALLVEPEVSLAELEGVEAKDDLYGVCMDDLTEGVSGVGILPGRGRPSR